MADLAINIEKLCKSVAGHTVLEQIDLSVGTGEYMGIIGANGAGKTTLMKCILDFCDVTSGKITVFGITHKNRLAREKLAFMPESFTPPYYLTAQDFLHYIMQLYGVKYDSNRVEELAAVLVLDISALLKPAKELSKGMCQKLGLLACLASNKDLMLFDEPMNCLDVKTRAHFRQYLMQLKQAGKTVVFSTHLLTDAELLCDRIAIIHDGRIRFHGTTQTCMDIFKADNLEQAYLNCIQ